MKRAPNVVVPDKPWLIPGVIIATPGIGRPGRTFRVDRVVLGRWGIMARRTSLDSQKNDIIMADWCEKVEESK